MENLRFKFRAWCLARQEMIKEVAILKSNYEGGYNISSDIGLAISPDCKEFTLMQCTGLKDSEGKLIYEGDVVEVKDTEYPEYCDDFAGETAVITYRVEQAKWFFEHNPKDNSGSHINELIPDFYHFLKSYDQLEYIKIIGNVYENSELLCQEIK